MNENGRDLFRAGTLCTVPDAVALLAFQPGIRAMVQMFAPSNSEHQKVLRDRAVGRAFDNKAGLHAMAAALGFFGERQAVTQGRCLCRRHGPGGNQLPRSADGRVHDFD
jgi:hypothetical protein